VTGATLRKVLWIDLIGSAAVCIVLFAATAPIARGMGIAVRIAVAGGAILVPWLVLVEETVRRLPVSRALLTAMVIGNIGSGIAAMIVAVGFPSVLSAAGREVLAAFALGLLVLGSLELIGLRSQLHSSERSPVA
jgi:hypothetical protein